MKLRNEEGSVLVVAIVMLALLTLIGIISVNTATTEIQCANAHYRHTQAFYHAEAGANLALAAAKDRVRALRGNNNWEYWTSPDTFTNTDYSISNMQFSVSITPKRDVDGNIVLWGDSDNNGNFEENLIAGYPILTIRSTGRAASGAMAVVEVLARADILFGKVPSPLYGESGIDVGTNANNSVRTLAGIGEATGNVNNPHTMMTYIGDDTTCPDIDQENLRDVISPLTDDPTLTAAHVCADHDVCGTNDPARQFGTGPSFPINNVFDELKSRPYTQLITGPDQTVTLSSVRYGFKPAPNSDEADPGIFHCDKNLVLDGTTKINGILLVAGNLEIKGQVDVNGIIIVKGTTLIAGGGGLGVLGAMIGYGVITNKGGAGFVYDCRSLQALKGKYEQYKMLSWMTE